MKKPSAMIASALLVVTPLTMAAEESIEEIVVTARGVEESVRDIPVAVSVIDSTRMENLSVSSMEDVAAVTPQLNIVRAGSGSGTSISIRGIGSTSTSIGIEQSVSVILDGVYFPQGRVINEGLFDVRQVAVLKGPQALFFGKNATAGVVSIETNDPGDELEVMARVGYEVEQERTSYEGVISGPITDTIGARFAMRRVDSMNGDMSNAAVTTTYSTLNAANFASTVHVNPPPRKDYWGGEESLYMRGTLTFDPTDNLSFRLKGFKSEFEINSPTGGAELWKCPTLNGTPHQIVGGVPVQNPQAECRPDRSRSENPIPPTIAQTNPLLSRFGSQLGEDYDSWGVTLTGEMGFDPVDVTAIVNYHDQENNWVGDYDGGGATAIFAGENNTFDNLSIELRGVTTFEGRFNFVGGLYYQSTDRTFDQDVIFAGAEFSSAVDPTDRFTAYEKVSETEGETLSLYAEAIFDVTDTVQVTAGARYIDEEKKSFFEQPYVNPFFGFLFTRGRVDTKQTFDDVVPEVTVRWEATDNITLYAAYKEGFKSGGFSNSGILGAISGTLEDFTFDPEHVDGYEAGIKGAFLDGTLNVEFEVYTYDFDDLQIDFFNSPTFAFITTKAGGSKTDGAEVQFNWVPAAFDGLQLRGALIHNISEYTDFVAPSYAGQRPADGCTIFEPGQVPKQQLAGQRRSLAPKWAGMLALDYDFPLSGGLTMGFSANYQFKSKHQLNAFGNPYDIQASYETLDASFRVGAESGVWQVAFIARNLTNEYALLSSGDTPSTGGGTGTATGFVADRNGTPILGETYEIAVTVRF